MPRLESTLMNFAKHGTEENIKFFEQVKDYYNHYCDVRGVDVYKNAEYEHNVNFSTKDSKMHNALLERISKLANIDAKAMKENPIAFATNPIVGWSTFAVITSTVDAILPDSIMRNYGIIADVRNYGLCDSIKFRIRPRDYFIVTKAGRKKRTAEKQKQFSSDVTLVPENHMVTVQVDMYGILVGRESLADFMFKAARSVEIELAKDIYVAFDAYTKTLPQTPQDGELQVTGWNTESAVALAQRVAAWNGGAPATFVGTKLALSKVLPTNDANYRYLLESDYVRLGYIRSAYGFDLIELPQIADWTTPYKTLLDDNVIYVISTSVDKLIKVGIGENGISHQSGTYDYANLIQTGTISKEWGVAIATSAIAGRINLQ